jgi:MFS transporter, DHA1 family, multidrug resistance protein
MSIFGPLCIDMYLPALPDIGQQLHASASAVQLTLTACVIGIAAGQLLLGPVSDHFGRRLPLLAGLAAFVISSLACAVAPSIYLLTGFRLIQGIGGAAGIVISRSIVRDLHSGVALARFFATLMLATGLGPVLAPQLGSWILTVTTWRGVFVVLAVLGSVLLASAWWRVPETLPPDRRSAGGVLAALGEVASVGRDRVYLGYALACALAMGATFAYIAGSSFVLQDVYGLSPQVYGLVFALNGGAMVAGAQVSGRLAGRYGPAALLATGLITMTSGGALFLVATLAHSAGLAGAIAALIIVMAGWGLVGPNALALAMHRRPRAAGAASAVLGCLQFLMAAIVAPLPGLGGAHDPLPMAMLLVVMPAAAIVAWLGLGRPGRPGRNSPGAATASTEPVGAGEQDSSPGYRTGGARRGSNRGPACQASAAHSAAASAARARRDRHGATRCSR